MALTAAGVRIELFSPGFGAVRLNLYPRFAQGKTTFELRFQDQVRAGVCSKDFGNGACIAHLRFPGQTSLTEQAAFFLIAAPVIITVEIPALFPGWCSHKIVLYPRDVSAGFGVYPDLIADINELRYLYM